MGSRSLAPLLLAAALALAACGRAEPATVATGVSVDDGDGFHGAYLDRPYRLATATLEDTSGQPTDLVDALEEPLTLLFFGYTRCPDICLTVMADLASARARLDPTTAEDVAVWFVTTDPARDDPAVLRTYLDRFDRSFEGFTGPLRDIVDVAGSVHVSVEQGRRLPSGGYEVNHGTPVLALTPDGRVRLVWTEGTSASSIAEDVTAIVEERAG